LAAALALSSSARLVTSLWRVVVHAPISLSNALQTRNQPAQFAAHHFSSAVVCGIADVTGKEAITLCAGESDTLEVGCSDGKKRDHRDDAEIWGGV
jgi:hypothetical protein